MAIINRLTGIVVGTTEGASSIINMGSWSGGSFLLTSAGPTTITWYERVVEGGAFLPARRGGVVVTQTVTTSNPNEVPETLNACAELKAVASVGTAGAIALVLKEMGGIA